MSLVDKYTIPTSVLLISEIRNWVKERGKAPAALQLSPFTYSSLASEPGLKLTAGQRYTTWDGIPLICRDDGGEPYKLLDAMPLDPKFWFDN